MSKRKNNTPEIVKTYRARLAEIFDNVSATDMEIAGEILDELEAAGYEYAAGGNPLGFMEDAAVYGAANPGALIYDAPLYADYPNDVHVQQIVTKFASHKAPQVRNKYTGESVDPESVRILVRAYADGSGIAWGISVDAYIATPECDNYFDITDELASVYDERGKVTRADVLAVLWLVLLTRAADGNRPAANAVAWEMARQHIRNVAKARRK